MKLLRLFCLIHAGLFLFCALSSAQPVVHHNLKVALNPGEHTIQVEDRIEIPQELSGQKGESLSFILFKGFDVIVEGEGVETTRKPLPGYAGKVPVDRISLKWEKERIIPSTLTLHYRGAFYFAVAQLSEEYARSFSETPGIISDEGVFLAASSYWIPAFEESLATFKMQVSLPKGWNAVTQGRRESLKEEKEKTIVCWDSPHPADEIYLIAGKYHEFTRSAGPATAMVFLRSPDTSLANKYLEATSQYLELYSRLIGPYPYSKFALVENFWETGYGMPSFTLLGPTVIRFPWILHSSYPHEILHNWWGNSVFVEYETGNWCEGLTAYLADHLIKEQRGQGEDYRRTALQKYTDYVRRKNDFPLREFRSRHSAAEEAVGYGKCLMMFHMLRRDLGDDLFSKCIKGFYRSFRFQKASFEDVRESFEKTSGKDLKAFFHLWTARPGAPSLRLANVNAKKTGDGHHALTFTLHQDQAEEPFACAIPVAVHFEEGNEPLVTNVSMEGREKDFALSLDAHPARITIDPQFDLFRRLDRFEIPPAFSKLFGAEKVLILLPSNAPEDLAAGYRDLAERWAGGKEKEVKVSLDREFERLPEAEAIWLFGWENTHLASVRSALEVYKSSLNEGEFQSPERSVPRKGHSIVTALRHPNAPDSTVAWLGVDVKEAFSGLSRKLPHYGKYSFLAFQGEEPTNMLKGQWPAVKSPMSAEIAGAGKEGTRAKLPSRKALAYPRPLFSEKNLKEHVAFLASDEMKGRGLGTPELDRASEYIRTQFQAAGLKPGGSHGTYFQEWEEQGGQESRLMRLRNVIGLLPGTSDKLSGQALVVSAHYDHIGLGWPMAHEGNQGKIHNGADDNASGVAVLLELARILAKEGGGPRSILFVAFTGEESGCRGSKHFVKTYSKYPARESIANVNLDTVGRLGSKKLLILGAGSAREWPFIFMGCSMVTGIQCEPVTRDYESSDQASFGEVGVPGVQIFSGAHEDMHRPSDDIDKVDVPGLVKVATVVREALSYLAEREEPLTSSESKKEAEKGPPSKTTSGRRVTTGCRPDFSYSGEGMRVAAVSKGSGAEKAGVQPGDVLLKIDGKPLSSLAVYARELARHAPGDEVTFTIRRDGKEFDLRLKLDSRN